MKVLVVVACALAVAAASYHDVHIPVITSKGVPLDTPEVRAARSEHLRAVHVAEHRSGYGNWRYGGNYGNHGNNNGLYGNHNGRYGNNYGDDNNGYNSGLQRYSNWRQNQHGNDDGSDGQWDNSQSHWDDSNNYNGLSHGHRYHGPQHYPVITKQGVPLDTADVRHARARHFNAYHAAQYRNGDYAHGNDLDGRRDDDDDNDDDYDNNNNGYGLYGSNNGNSLGYASAYNHDLHHPIIGKNGVPLDTPEVQAARRHHFAAYENAAHRSQYGGNHNYARDYDRGYHH